MTVTETKKTLDKQSQDDLFEVNLPMMSLQVHRPHMQLPHPGKAEAQQAMRTAKSMMPTSERIVYYGGLGALAVLGVIEWPIAAAIGIGTMVASHARAAVKTTKPTPAADAKPARAAAAKTARAQAADAKMARPAPKRAPTRPRAGAARGRKQA
ncbi:hypothetical protein Acor_71920 [Acrocarpospora corrugata]|uniref:Uncharacterized protein n=1 Tax=Acrocarpospora corrugata TaxID=35763 RepID=A0A5M3W8E2_9ACTN|nr:hypothetical protein [Acrocarpospora corrugata]GES05124.1 hypothetical protein Acor_71920 [Acrocarpospora corrugata]